MTNASKRFGLLPVFGVVLALAACAVPGSKSAKSEDPNLVKLQQVYARYYSISDQNFRELSCTITSPILQNAVRRIRGEFASLGVPVSVTDTLDKYKLVYTKQDGPQISDPGIFIQPQADAKIPNPSLFHDGVNKITSGFKQMIHGNDAIVLGAFKAPKLPDVSSLSVLYVTTVGNTDNYSYTDQHDLIQVTGSISPLQETRKVHFADQDITETGALLATSHGKLLRTVGDMLLTTPGGSQHIITKIHYQEIGGLEIPSEISVSMRRDTMDFSHMDAAVEVSLSNCQVK